MGWRGMVGVVLALGVCACSDDRDGGGGVGGSGAAGGGAANSGAGKDSGAGNNTGAANNNGAGTNSGAGVGGTSDAGAPGEGGSGAHAEQGGEPGNPTLGGAAGAAGDDGTSGASDGGKAGVSGGGTSAGTTIGSGGEAGEESGEWPWAVRAGHAYGGGFTVTAIAALPDGTSYIGGYFFGTLVLGKDSITSAGYNDGFVLKLDAAGSLAWAKRFGGDANDGVDALTVLANGGVVVAGHCIDAVDFEGVASVDHGYTDVFVVEYDAAGAQQWVDRAGSILNEVPTAVAVGADGSVYVGGGYNQTTQFGDTTLDGPTLDYPGQSAFLAKYHSDGSVAWLVDATHATADSSLRAIAAHTDGSVYIAGKFAGTAKWGATSLVAKGTTDAFLAKLDVDGKPLWAHQEGTDGPDEANDLALLNDGSVYVSGALSGGTVLLVQYSSAGKRAHDYANVFSYSQEPLAIAAKPDGSVYVAGRFAGISGQFGKLQLDNRNAPDYSSYDSFLLELDANGAAVAANHLPAQDGNVLPTLALLADGTAYATGQNRHCGQPVNIGYAIEPLYLSKSDASGACAWDVMPARSWWSQMTLAGLAAAPDGNSSFVIGNFSGVFDFGSTRLTAKNGDSSLAKLDARGKPLWAVAVGSVYGITSQSVAAAGDGSVFVGGHYGPSGGQMVDQPLVTKLDSSGKRVWTLKGTGYGEGTVHALSVFPDNSVLALATFGQFWTLNGTPIPDKNNGTMVLIKLKANGDIAWITNEGTDGMSIRLGSVVALADGSSYVTGAIFQPGLLGDLPVGKNNGTFSGFLAKYDAAGKATWVDEQFGQTGGSYTETRSVAPLPDGGALVTGVFWNDVDIGGNKMTTLGSDWFVAKYDGTTCKWAQQAGAVYAEGTQVAALSDGSAYVMGFHTNSNPDGNLFGIDYTPNPFLRDQYMLARLTSQGKISGLTPLTIGYAGFGSMAVLPSGAILFAGGINDTATFGATTLRNYGAFELFVAKHAAVP